jgi:hypothetical protein
MKILPLGVDELIAVFALVIGLFLQTIPFMSTVAGAAFLYILMCVFFRKYEAVQRKLMTLKDPKQK